MSDIDLISVSNENVQTINVEISNLTNSVDVEFGQNTAAAINFHNQNQNSHPYFIEKLTEKVDIEAGKGLSQNDFTDEVKNFYDSSISEIQSNISVMQQNLVDIENSQHAISTQSQALAGTDDTTIMTPLKVKQSIQMNSPQIYLKETYVNGTSGYRIWSDGYCEQWGTIAVPLDTRVTVSLLKIYLDQDYNILLQQRSFNTGRTMYINGCTAIVNNNSSFFIDVNNYAETYSWLTSGYLAQGQY